MAKSRREGQTSKGERNNVRRDITKALRRDYLEREPITRMNNKIAAFKKGKNVVVTIYNPNGNETNKRFIRVKAKDVWFFNNPYIMKQNTTDNV